MRWKQIYAERTVTAEEAVKHIKSNDYIVVGHAAGEPGIILDAMVADKDRYTNVMMMHMIAMGTSPYCSNGLQNNFIHNSFFCGKTTRDAVNDGRAIFTPMFQHEVPLLFTRGTVKVDVALIKVSKPDKHGYCSHSVSVDYTKDAAQVAELVIAEVSDRMPRTLGDTFIHVSDIDYIVETSRLPVIIFAFGPGGVVIHGLSDRHLDVFYGVDSGGREFGQEGGAGGSGRCGADAFAVSADCFPVAFAFVVSEPERIYLVGFSRFGIAFGGRAVKDALELVFYVFSTGCGAHGGNIRERRRIGNALSQNLAKMEKSARKKWI
ncbi:MAG: hypothetical protein LBR94_07145 [Desulfovibrio sp.]|jgi:hypothetical protein|nr:hypothetical protein [Desulfovibrio sp.]